MTRLEPLTKIIVLLGLTMFVCTLVHSLETGYDYTDEQTIESDQLHEDLKCGYLFGWYTYMRLFKLLLEAPYNRELEKVVCSINRTGHLARTQIISLLGLKTIPIDIMWTVYLFTSMVKSFYGETMNPAVDHPKVFQTLGYVVNKLEAYVARCRPVNSYDNYDIVLKVLQTDGPDYYLTTVVNQFVYRGKNQLRRNGIISNEALVRRLGLNLLIQTLFFENLGTDGRLKNELQNAYNLRMEWNSTSAVLYTVWENARYLDWTTSNLISIKLYFNACYDFFKIIIHRLTLKHMTYLLDFPVKTAPFFRYVQEWYNVVIRFNTIIRLSNDINMNRLLETLGNLIEGTQTLAEVVDYLTTILITLCQPFGCDGDSEFVINNREFTFPYTTPVGVRIKSIKIRKSHLAIEYNSLENAKLFLTHLELVFGTVNFHIIRSLTDYIDELNPPPSLVGTEEITEGLQNLPINMADFE